MSTRTESAVYSPYGAYELKAKYQRNLLLGTLLTIVTVLLSVGGAWFYEAPKPPIICIPPEPITKVRISVSPQPVVLSIVREFRPVVQSLRTGHIPVPVSDSLIFDDNVVIASRSELAELLPSGDQTGRGGMIGFEDPFDGLQPGRTQFVAVEVQPEMIYRHLPAYPRQAEKAGITGVVWVKALVDENGNVLKVLIGKTSGVVLLDEASVAAAMKCKYKPAIQNGRPVKVWVTYKYEFELEN